HEMGLPVLNADEWLEFCLARDAAAIADTAWQGEALSFTVTRGRDGSGLTAMAPIPEGKRVAQVSVDGQAAESTLRRVHGHDYALVALPAAAAGVASKVQVSFA
ncbi:MAG: hypothetical protein ACYC5O_14550, partial [Anaerolineae bacterium]